jgi:hypothetical protein
MKWFGGYLLHGKWFIATVFENKGVTGSPVTLEAQIASLKLLCANCGKYYAKRAHVFWG